MRSFMLLFGGGRLVAFARRSIAAIARRQRLRREEDTLARLEDCVLRDVGLDRCQIRYVAPSRRAGATGDDPPSTMPPPRTLSRAPADAMTH